MSKMKIVSPGFLFDWETSIHDKPLQCLNSSQSSHNFSIKSTINVNTNMLLFQFTHGRAFSRKVVVNNYAIVGSQLARIYLIAIPD